MGQWNYEVATVTDKSREVSLRLISHHLNQWCVN
jgi:hypothetical protein